MSWKDNHQIIHEKEQTHDIESETKLVSMLGYKLVGPDNSNRWLIIDEDNNQKC